MKNKYQHIFQNIPPQACADQNLVYIKLSFMVHGHRFIFLSINLVKIHNTPQIGGLTTIKSLFLGETETTKISNLFDIHHILLKDATMH